METNSVFAPGTTAEELDGIDAVVAELTDGVTVENDDDFDPDGLEIVDDETETEIVFEEDDFDDEDETDETDEDYDEDEDYDDPHRNDPTSEHEATGAGDRDSW